MAKQVSIACTKPTEEQIRIAVVSMQEEPYWSPGNSKRLSKAERLYRERGVTPTADGFLVQASDEQEPYLVNPTCPCAYSQGREDRWCAHRIASALYATLEPDGRAEEEAITEDRPASSIGQADMPTTSPADVAPSAVSSEAIATARRLIVTRLHALGYKPTSKDEFNDLTWTMVGLELVPDNFPLIAERLQELLDDRAALPPPPKPLLTPETLPPEMLQDVHGKKHIRFIGLLAMAHQRGLTELSAEFISVTPELALAKAHAFFADGRRFFEAADATEKNVSSAAIKVHFPRMALTRAKARCLRDALNIADASAEEMN